MDLYRYDGLKYPLGLQREGDDASCERGGGRGSGVADGARVVVVGGGDLLVGVGAAGEGHGQGARALLSVPWKLACSWENVNVNMTSERYSQYVIFISAIELRKFAILIDP